MGQFCFVFVFQWNCLAHTAKAHVKDLVFLALKRCASPGLHEVVKLTAAGPLVLDGEELIREQTHALRKNTHGIVTGLNSDC